MKMLVNTQNFSIHALVDVKMYTEVMELLYNRSIFRMNIKQVLNCTGDC